TFESSGAAVPATTSRGGNAAASAAYSSGGSAAVRTRCAKGSAATSAGCAAARRGLRVGRLQTGCCMRKHPWEARGLDTCVNATAARGRAKQPGKAATTRESDAQDAEGGRHRRADAGADDARHPQDGRDVHGYRHGGGRRARV